MADFYGDLGGRIGSDDESQISDVDPSQLAKMVENVDDLDADLFGSSFSKKQEKLHSTKTPVKSALKSSSVEEGTERPHKSHVTFDSPHKSSVQKTDNKSSVKKNIDFGDFDADDPLGDLLLDEDEEHSETKKKSGLFNSNVTEPSRRQQSISDPSESKNKQNKAKVIAELFGLEDEKKQSQQSQRDRDSSSSWLGLKDHLPAESKMLEVVTASHKTPEHEKASTKKSSAFKRAGSGDGNDDDGGDLLAGMGFGSEMRGSAGNQPKSKLDELLGKNASVNEDTPPRSMLDDLLGKETSSRDSIFAGDGRRRGPQETQTHQPESGVSFGNYSPSLSVPGRRPSSRHNTGTATLPDPLGIFSSAPSPQQEIHQPSSTVYKIADKPRVANRKAPSAVTDRRQQMADGNEMHPDWLGGGGTVAPELPKTQSAPALSVPKPTTVQASSVPLTQPLGNGVSGMGVLAVGSQMDQQVVASLQHQEMQLLTALHLKQHEERLSALHMRQQEMLQHQEQQLEELIRRQIQRQEQLDVHMKSQQERISSHIQLLLAQPVTNPTTASPVVLPSPVLPSAAAAMDHKADESQVTVEQVKAEKLLLESTLESLKAKHLEELQLLEDSYRREIAMLESSSKRQEQRLRAENEWLERDFQTRMTRMQEEQTSLIEQHQQRLAAQQKEHLEELQQLRTLHHRDLEETQKQHSDMLEHLKRAHALESDALKEASSYKKSLQVALEQLGRNSQDLSGLRAELNSEHQSQLDTREGALQAQETELRVTRENLEKQRIASEEERKRLVGLIAQLEQRLAEQRQNAEEERWNLRQEASRLDAATKALEKERERAVQQIERERQQLQSLKESMLSEQQLLSQQLQQEKLSLASEKSRLDTLARLHGTASPELSKLRAELEAGLKVAKEASQQAESEREQVRSQQCHLDEERRHLEDFECDLTSRARELETLTQMAVATKEEGRRALEEARKIEKQRSEQAADIQRQLAELLNREKRLAQEKVFLAQERLSLQNQRSRELCTQCHRSTTVMLSPPPTPSDLDKRFVDPKKIIMKLAAEDEASKLEQYSHHLSSHLSASK